MKNIFLLATITSFGIFALAGCGAKTSENTNTAANGNTAGKANTATTGSEKPADKILKIDEINPDKAMMVNELIDSIMADANRNAWKGKEVTVTGFVMSRSPSPRLQTVTVINDKTFVDQTNKRVSCGFEGKMPEGLKDQTIEFRGKILDLPQNPESPTIYLEPCELKK